MTIAAVWLVGCATVPPPPALPLWDAVELGRVEVVRQHLAAGTDVNAWGGITGLTALHEAAFLGREEIAVLLIGAGADVNAASQRGETPLHLSVYWEHREIAELLLAHGAALPVCRRGAADERGPGPQIWRSRLLAPS